VVGEVDTPHLSRLPIISRGHQGMGGLKDIQKSAKINTEGGRAEKTLVKRK